MMPQVPSTEEGRHFHESVHEPGGLFEALTGRRECGSVGCGILFSILAIESEQASPDGTMADALQRSSDALSEALRENQRLRGALQRIVAMDYRGSEPMEQRIAREALR